MNPEQERAAFEAWAKTNDFELHRDNSDKYRDYHRATTRWAWGAWQARAVLTAEPASAQAHSLGLLLCELIECEAIGPFTDVMPPALLERWQDACDKHIANTLTYNG